MRYLGIDFGLRYIGLAFSDEEGKFAFPERVLERPANPIDEIKMIAKQKNVQAIVIGESKDFKGKDNTIMPQLLKLKNDLEGATNLPIHFEPEFLTSHQAGKLQDKSDNIHASAAALILQSFLDRQNTAKSDPNDQELDGRWQKDRPE